MTTIFLKDALRARVERISGGQQTVLYTAKGQPTYMNVVPGWKLEDIAPSLGSGLHPAFVVDGHGKSELFYGTYLGVMRNGELLSIPGVPPGCSFDFDSASRAARACGTGWHLSTNAERAALMLWCYARGHVPHGNTDFGRCVEAPEECGARIDGGECGRDEGSPATLTGSGPSTWRHDHSPHGIADLCGNLWEWQAGLRLVDGEIQVIPDNDAASDAPAGAPDRWAAIRRVDGELVPPGSAGTVKLDAPRAEWHGNAGLPLIAETITHRNGVQGSDANTPGLMDAPFNEMKMADIGASRVLGVLGLAPHAAVEDGDQIYMRNYGERIFLSGGAWYSGRAGGLRALCLSHPRSHASASVGARPAFVL